MRGNAKKCVWLAICGNCDFNNMSCQRKRNQRRCPDFHSVKNQMRYDKEMKKEILNENSNFSLYINSDLPF